MTQFSDGSAVDFAHVLGWRDAGPEYTDLVFDSGAVLTVRAPSSEVAKAYKAWKVGAQGCTP